VDTGLEKDTEYFYRLFPYSATGAINSDESQVISVVPLEYNVWGVAIDETNSDPLNALTYTDNAVGMTPGGGDWDETDLFKNIRPCMLKNGVVQYYLDPNDFTKKADGTAADITSGNDGDVMIEIPKMAYSIVRANNTLYVQITDNPNPPQDYDPATGEGSNYRFYGHTRDTEGDRDFLYVSAYEGYVSSSKLRSLSGKTPTTNQSMSNFRTYAQANGSGYDMLAFYPLTLLQTMYIVRFKNLNSQAALGLGYVGQTSGKQSATTGGTNTSGMYYGDKTSSMSRVKFAGIEDIWGNIFDFIEGLIVSSNNALVAFKNFNNSGSGYTTIPVGKASEGYIKTVKGTTELGFTVDSDAGSGSTYYSDKGSFGGSSTNLIYPLLDGGGWRDAPRDGIFALFASYGSSGGENISARLMYL
jgi:hypothetical protein